LVDFDLPEYLFGGSFDDYLVLNLGLDPDPSLAGTELHADRNLPDDPFVVVHFWAEEEDPYRVWHVWEFQLSDRLQHEAFDRLVDATEDRGRVEMVGVS